MKKIGLITTNKVLAQSLAASVKSNPDLRLEPFLLLNPHQATMDAEVVGVHIAVIDVVEVTSKEIERALSICKQLRQRIPDCRLLLLVSQDNEEGHKMALDAIKDKIVDDFALYGASLKCFHAKLADFG
jgi:hypothetical protein